MKTLKFVVLASALSASGSAWSTSGNDLMNWLASYESSQANWSGGMYLGYVAGVAEFGQGFMFCAPGNVTQGQNAAIVAKYLRNNPEEWNRPASGIALRAFMKAYPPCPEKKKT